MAYKIDIKTAVAIGLSAIIGDTLFVVTGIPISQDGATALIAFFAVGVIAMLIALVLGELSSMMPKTKGVSYSYSSRAFGSELGFITGILLSFAYCATISAVSFSFGAYFLSMLGIAASVQYQIMVAAALIIALALINMYGLKETARLDIIMVIITLLTAALFVAYAFLHGNWSMPFGGLQLPSRDAVTGFSEAITTIVFAYAGFQALTGLTNEIKGKGIASSAAMIYAIAISIAVYLLVALGILLLVPSTLEGTGAQPLVTALAYAHAPFLVSTLVDLGTLVAIAAATMVIMLTVSRLIYQIGKDGLLPKITRSFSNDTGAAVSGIWISATVSIVLLFSGSVYTILSLSNFGIIFSWMMACFALINMRRRGRVGKFRAPLYPYLPLIAIAACVIFIFGLPRSALAVGVILILALMVIYSTISELKYRNVPRVRLFD